MLAELRTLPADLAEVVARHLVMIGRLIDDEPQRAWEHGKLATRLAARVSMVREAAGLAAYAAGDYQAALSELRAARRMSGDSSTLPVLADCERAIGRPLKALELAGSSEADKLDKAGRVELRIVASGARADLGQLEASLVTLHCPELKSESTAPWSARVKYAYAEALIRLDRTTEATEWFKRAAAVDVEGSTDAAERAGLDDGVTFFELD